MPNPFQRVAVAAGNTAGVPATTSAASGPSNGLLRGPVDFTAARGEISDVTSGRVTLAMLDLIIIGLIGFYVMTRTAQGGS